MNSRKTSSDRNQTLHQSSSEFSHPKPINRLTFKEQLQNIKSLNENEYKLNLAQLLASYNHETLGDSILSRSRNSILSSPKISSSTNLPTLKIPRHPNHDLSPTNSNKTTEKTLELFAPITKKPTLILSPINTVKNLVTKVAFRSKPGKVQGAVKMHNQDKIKILSQIHNVKGQFMFCVVDGHGAHGHFISQFIKKSFSREIKQSFPSQPNTDNIKKTVQKALENIVKELNKGQFNLIFSGATFTAVFIYGNCVVCGNIGTCKAVIGQDRQQWQASVLTGDHSLNNPKEKERLLSQNARIVRETDMYGFPSEIFFTNNENFPGLEITRSIGDKIGKFVGMTSSIEIKPFELTVNDKFLIIGTENLWKALSPLEAVCVARLGWTKNSADQACEDLILHAERKLRDNIGVVDDLTVIVVFF